MKEENITFSFGDNWKNFLQTVNEKEIIKAKSNIQQMLGPDTVVGKNIIDIGCGSGIHSLSYLLLGANSVFSFDYDKNSVEATQQVWTETDKPSNWKIEHGSILDDRYISKFEKFDIVYSWGVLHHSGNMWKAIENAFKLVKPGGYIWLSLYCRTNTYKKDLKLKQKYNKANRLGKSLMESKVILHLMISLLIRFQNPFKWNKKKERGMNTYHDIVDWLGGLPYEVASADEILQYGLKKGFKLIKITTGEACQDYVFKGEQ